ncbi:MAG: VCBS repeat-containing protein [Verrucomicrobia bacterium]|nr:VCBS repeat-containing protein [Verrucomicrobiota bacterium]
MKHETRETLTQSNTRTPMNSTQPSFRSPRAGLVLALASTLFLAPGFRAAQFEETTRAAGLLDSNAQSISAAWGDYNNDGLPDLFITAGWMQARTNFLYRNAGDGTFVKVGPEAGPIVTDARTSFGAFWVDFNNDGYRDLLLINDGWGTQGRSDLYWNHGDGTFGRGCRGVDHPHRRALVRELHGL